VTPAASVALIAAGTLLGYFEMMRPGMVVPGVAGLSICCWGAYAAAQNHPRPSGLLLVAAATACFASRVFAPTRGLLLPAGIAFAGAAGLCLFAQPSAIVTILMAVLAVFTAALCNSAARARRNKRMDLD
jgi:membrane-bound ClpP family serine protease